MRDGNHTFSENIETYLNYFIKKTNIQYTGNETSANPLNFVWTWTLIMKICTSATASKVSSYINSDE